VEEIRLSSEEDISKLNVIENGKLTATLVGLKKVRRSYLRAVFRTFRTSSGEVG
jgi:hypothetical protein